MDVCVGQNVCALVKTVKVSQELAKNKKNKTIYHMHSLAEMQLGKTPETLFVKRQAEAEQQT